MITDDMYIFIQPPEQYNIEDMKHSALDPRIENARRSGLESADKIRNSVRGSDSPSNVVNVLQQNCVNTQEMGMHSDSAKTAARNSGNLKLPGTSVRHMQQKSRSMSCDNDKPESTVQQNKETFVQNGGSNQLKRSASVAGPLNNGDTGLSGSQGSDKTV